MRSAPSLKPGVGPPREGVLPMSCFSSKTRKGPHQFRCKSVLSCHAWAFGRRYDWPPAWESAHKKYQSEAHAKLFGHLPHSWRIFFGIQSALLKVIDCFWKSGAIPGAFWCFFWCSSGCGSEEVISPPIRWPLKDTSTSAPAWPWEPPPPPTATGRR